VDCHFVHCNEARVTMTSTLRVMLFLGVVASASAASASTQMFPALRKRKLAAVQTVAEKASVKAEAAPADAAVVPSVVDAGADGFPTLPGVSQMLGAASGTVKSVTSQASGLEAQVVQAQMMSETKMAKQKAAFEEKLKLQEEGNRKVIEANGKTEAEIKGLQSSNAALKKQSHEIEKTNKVMRSQLKTLQARLGVGKDFTAKSLTATDDSKSALLQVLKKGPAHHHAALVETASKSKRDADDDDDEEDSDDSSDDKDDDEEDDEATSLLQVADESTPADAEAVEAAGPSLEANAAAPGDLLEVLAKDVAHLAQQEKESEKNLKALFIRDYRAGVKRNKALLGQQKTLLATRKSLLTLQAQLKTAVAHLVATRTQLEARLKGLGQYLQKLAHFAMAPEHEVPHLMEVLPKAVSIKAEKAI